MRRAGHLRSRLAGPATLTAHCSYCNSSLSVPDEMRGLPAQIISQVNIDLRNTGTKATKWILLIVIGPSRWLWWG